MSDNDSDSGDEFNLFAEGSWTWNEILEELEFIKYPKAKKHEPVIKLIVVNNIKFNDDVNPFELARFAKYFRRKSKDDVPDVVLLQDVKDYVLFTAPAEILSQGLVKILHSFDTERFLRALILYTQYYLQVADIMQSRIAELSAKLRTIEAERYDDVLADNLQELRIILGREYILLLMGINSYAKYHHMGKEKKLRSLAKKDINFFECFLKIAIQIVYVALYRRNYDEISSEINRVLKTENFGQLIKTSGLTPPRVHMTEEQELERAVLRGKVYHNETVLTRKSPLVEQLLVQKPTTDCRILHAGQFAIPGRTSPRLEFFQRMLSASEERLHERDESLGIIGLLRENFDTALKLIPVTSTDSKKMHSSRLMQIESRRMAASTKSSMSQSNRNVKGAAKKKMLDVVKIPECSGLYLMDRLEWNPLPPLPTDKVQRKRWLRHLDRKRRKSMKR